ncbi:MAG: pilin [Patescibacteria group bacterium]|jgi:hypothetical protein
MKLFKKIFLGLNLLLSFLTAQVVLAQIKNTTVLDRLKNAAGAANLSTTEAGPRRITINIINYLLGFLGIYFVISIIYAGYQWMSSGGEEDKIQGAKDRLKNSIIGLVIILSAGIIVAYVTNIVTRTTTDYYYGIPAGGNPDGSCSKDADCVKDFGPNWSCNNSNSCIFTGEQAPACTSDYQCTNIYNLDNTECRDNKCRPIQ